MQAAVQLMEISFCFCWLSTLRPPHLSPLPHSYSLPSYCLSPHAISLCLLLHPAIADPAPAVHLFIPYDVTQSNNVSLFRAGTLCSRFNARKQAEHHDNEVMATRAVERWLTSHVTLRQHDLVHREPSVTQCSTYYKTGIQNLSKKKKQEKL